MPVRQAVGRNAPRAGAPRGDRWAGIFALMTRAGNAEENAHAEGFMKTLKHEDINPRGSRTMADVIAHLPHFPETTDNNKRQHSVLNYRSPYASEAEHALTLLAGQITHP